MKRIDCPINNRRVISVWHSKIRDIKEIIISAIIEDLCRKKKWEQRQELVRKYKKGRTLEALASSSEYIEISSYYLSNILHTSVSTAHKYKQSAYQKGIIEIKKNLINLEQPANVKNSFLTAFPEFDGRIRTFNNSLFLISSDLIRTNIIIRRKKTNYINRRD